MSNYKLRLMEVDGQLQALKALLNKKDADTGEIDISIRARTEKLKLLLQDDKYWKLSQELLKLTTKRDATLKQFTQIGAALREVEDQQDTSAMMAGDFHWLVMSIEADKTNGLAWQRLGTVLETRKKHHAKVKIVHRHCDSVYCFRQAVTNAPMDSLAWGKLGMALRPVEECTLFDPDNTSVSGMSCLVGSLKLDAENGPVWKSLARALRKTNTPCTDVRGILVTRKSCRIAGDCPALIKGIFTLVETDPNFQESRKDYNRFAKANTLSRFSSSWLVKMTDDAQKAMTVRFHQFIILCQKDTQIENLVYQHQTADESSKKKILQTILARETELHCLVEKPADSSIFPTSARPLSSSQISKISSRVTSAHSRPSISINSPPQKSVNEPPRIPPLRLDLSQSTNNNDNKADISTHPHVTEGGGRIQAPKRIISACPVPRGPTVQPNPRAQIVLVSSPERRNRSCVPQTRVLALSSSVSINSSAPRTPSIQPNPRSQMLLTSFIDQRSRSQVPQTRALSSACEGKVILRAPAVSSLPPIRRVQSIQSRRDQRNRSPGPAIRLVSLPRVSNPRPLPPPANPSMSFSTPNFQNSLSMSQNPNSRRRSRMKRHKKRKHRTMKQSHVTIMAPSAPTSDLHSHKDSDMNQNAFALPTTRIEPFDRLITSLRDSVTAQEARTTLVEKADDAKAWYRLGMALDNKQYTSDPTGGPPVSRLECLTRAVEYDGTLSVAWKLLADTLQREEVTSSGANVMVKLEFITAEIAQERAKNVATLT